MVATYRSGNGHGINNLIAGLNATGHVTHTQHRKDKVTVHHNGGRLSHQGVLNVWKTRPASAHFDVDAAGDVAQYVEMNEYAWACGNTEGNQRSISIEMCNLATSGDWPVSETTWREAARLAGWIHAKVFGFRPTGDSIVPHHHWKSTTCAGPYMDAHFGQFIQVAQQAYDFFRAGGPSNPVPPPAPSGGNRPISEIVDEVIAGKWGNGDDRRNRLRAAGYNPDQIQGEVNRKLGGGTVSSGKSISQLADEVLAGAWGNNPEREQRLNAAGYDAHAVQSEVNRRLGGGAPASHKPDLYEVARQVIAGQWGNGNIRRQRLEGAGYNYRQVQDEVNRQLR